MGLVAIGPVVLDEYDHGNPTFSWTSDLSPSGMRGVTIGGLMTWAQATTLSELLANFSAARTIHGVTGIRADIAFTGSRFSPFAGKYLLTGFSFDPQKSHTMSDNNAPFSLSGFFLVALS